MLHLFVQNRVNWHTQLMRFSALLLQIAVRHDYVYFDTAVMVICIKLCKWFIETFNLNNITVLNLINILVSKWVMFFCVKKTYLASVCLFSLLKLVIIIVIENNAIEYEYNIKIILQWRKPLNLEHKRNTFLSFRHELTINCNIIVTVCN